MATHTVVGPLWLEICHYPSRREDLIQRGTGQEESFPWRSGPCRIFRMPFTTAAIAVGLWKVAPAIIEDEDGPMMEFEQIDWEDVIRVQEEG